MFHECFFSGVNRVRAQFLEQRAVRITHAPLEASPFPPDRPWLDQVLLFPDTPPSAEERELDVELQEGCTYVRTRAGRLVLAESCPAALAPDGKARLAFRIASGEGFYGWGEWFNAFRREKGRFRLRIAESPFFLQGRQTYSTVPFFLSSQGYGVLLLNSYQSTWNIDPRRGVLEVETDGPPADYIVILGPTFRQILETYTQLTGRPPLPPRWIFGLWGTSYPQEHQDVMLARVEEHRRRRIPLDALILDYHWEDGYHNFRWRRALFPKPQEFLEALRNQGVKLGLILTPFLNTRNLPWQKRILNLAVDNIPGGLERDDERALAEYDEAKEKGYLAHEKARWWFGQGGMFDFTNPEASAWWNARLKKLYDQGVAFIKNDDGEYLPAEARSHLGMDGEEYHNLYGFFYSRAIYEGMTALDDRRPLVYARSVWTGSQRYPAMFLGDQIPTFSCLRSTMRAGLNMSLAGFSYWTADIFGLNGKTNLETHMRYAQWALMVPVARYFWRPPEVDDTRFPWSHGPPAEANFRKYAELRYRLLPYYYALAWEAYLTGMPIMRPLVLEFGDDARAANVSDQVMLGNAIMLAPVVESGVSQRQIYLPEGMWYDFWSRTSWHGGQAITYPAPMDRLPLLVRGGTILPMAAPISHIPADHRFDALEFHIWPTFPAQGVVYDDDGHSRAYQAGAFSKSSISATQDGRQIDICLSSAEGIYQGQADIFQTSVILHEMTEPEAARRQDGTEVAWKHRPREGTTSFQLSCSRREETTLNVTISKETTRR